MIMHSIIIENECNIKTQIRDARSTPVLQVEMARNNNACFQNFLTCNLQINNK